MWSLESGAKARAIGTVPKWDFCPKMVSRSRILIWPVGTVPILRP